jgi:hypothetical protein
MTTNKLVDWEFNWITTELENTSDGFPEMTCTRCGATGGTNEWIPFVNTHSKCEVKSDVQLALQEAVAAIYLNDSSDYIKALWSIVNALNPEIYAVAVDDVGKAFKLTHPEGDDA